jgi:hypothetical protein
LFETKYWLNRSLERQLMSPAQARDHAERLPGIARQLNAFAGSLKSQRKSGSKQASIVRELPADYVADVDDDLLLFAENELEWLQTFPISNL